MTAHQETTSLSAVSGTGTYAGNATLSATLTAGGSPPTGKTVAFTWNIGGTITALGSATTNTSGVATLGGITLAGINAGTYAGSVSATFAADAIDAASSRQRRPDGQQGRGDAQPRQPGLHLRRHTAHRHGHHQPHGPRRRLDHLHPEHVAVAAPTQAGSYAVLATLNNRNYTAADVTEHPGHRPRRHRRVSWPDPADITYGTVLGKTQLDATASVPGTFSYTPALGTILHAGANQPLTVTFTPTDAVDYTTAAATVQINVTAKALTVTGSNQSKPYGQTVTSPAPSSHQRVGQRRHGNRVT